MRRIILLLLISFFTASSLAGELKSPAARHVGAKVAAFKLQDSLGTWHSLDDFAEQLALVVVFFGVECPLAKLYGPRLAELANRYDPRHVAWIGINSNQQDTPTEITQYARTHGIAFPLLKDPANVIADRLGAQRTPEVFVLDQERVIRYWGKIDDQYGVGYARSEPTQFYLDDALKKLLAGKPISQPEVEPAGCHIGRVVRTAPHGDITYSDQISRVLQRRCVACHRDSGIGPFSLTSMDEVVGWAETMREVIENERMPPWHASPRFGKFSNDARMPEDEKRLFYQWVENGLPEGDPANLPPAPEYRDQWRIAKPDLVVRMPEPFRVPATGVVPYQYIVVDPGLQEDKWVRACEVFPGNPSVVHHIVAFIEPPGTKFSPDRVGLDFETLGAYVPGMTPLPLPEGTARLLPAGSKVVLQVHYTPKGSVQEDQSRLGLVFAERDEIQKSIQMGAVASFDFRIPAHAENHRVEASFRISHDLLLHSLTPHMHFRGKSFRYEAIYPNGAREVLLDVPRYDFNWQHVYRLTSPKRLPAGTLVHCTAHFDNSEDNPANPDPAVSVAWGEQTWEEMMIGYYEGVLINQDLSLPKPRIKSLGGGEFEVLFSYRPDRTANTVHLAGTFNEWSNSSHPLDGPDDQGRYRIRMRLNQGTHRYKFVVDRNYWTHDPASAHLVGVLYESLLVIKDPAAERTQHE